MEGLDSFIKEFNNVFEGAAVLSISPVKGEYLELTIGSRTASIQYPILQIVGASCVGEETVDN